MLKAIFGVDSTGYHAIQLTAFAANCVLAAWIARRLTGSWLRSFAVAILYAAAPGHAVAVFWVAAYTMIGTAGVAFAAIAWWLWTHDRVRTAGCTVLQFIGLLGSEHAVVLPILLFLTAVLGPQRERPRTAIRNLAPLILVDTAYLAVRLGFFLSHGFPSTGYAPHFDASLWLVNIGRYATASINVLTLAAPTDGALFTLGVGLVVAFGAGAVLVWRGFRWASVPTLGLGLFLTGLIPVLPLTRHYYDYYVGVSALGIAIGLIGLGNLVPRWNGVASVLLAAAVILTDVSTCDRAARSSAVLREVEAGQAASAELLMSLHATRALVGPERQLVVGRSPVTDYAIDGSHAEALFFDPSVHITVTGTDSGDGWSVTGAAVDSSPSRRAAVLVETCIRMDASVRLLRARDVRRI